MPQTEARRAYMREYMRQWYKVPKNALSAKASRQKWKSKPGVLAHLAAKKRAQNATPKGKQQQRARVLKRNYRITLQEYADMLAAQNGVCAICCATEAENGKHLCVDHNHTTGQLRGLLCGKCNQAIGLLRDKLSNALAAAAYLSRYEYDA